MLKKLSLVVAVTLLLLAAARAEDSQPLGTPSAATAEQLIAQLDDPDFKVRSAASLQLNNLPGQAVEAVEAAIKQGSASAEAQLRLQAALKVLRPRARNERLDHEAHEWEARLWRAGYHTPGRAPAPYDKAVDDAINTFITDPSEINRLVRDPHRDAVVARFKTAFDQGCDDLYVQCLCLISYAGHLPLKDQVEGDHKIVQFMDSTADPCLKLAVFRKYIPLMGTARFRLLKQFPNIAEQAVANHNVSETGLYTLLADLNVLLYNQASLNTTDSVVKAYIASRPNRLEPLIVLGFHQYFAAYVARGDSNDVPPAALKAFHEGLAAAQATLEQAWKLDPQDGRAPTLMLDVIRGQDLPDGRRDAVELWYRRAMDACPDSYDACMVKFKLLQSGPREELLKFGRECLQTSNWRAGIPFILVEMHRRIDQWDRKGRTYFSDPEVWKDIQDVYEGCLLNFPNDVVHRNQYLLLAIQARQYDVAQHQVDTLGDKADWWFNRRGSFGDAHRLREEKARAATRPTPNK